MPLSSSDGLATAFRLAMSPAPRACAMLELNDGVGTLKVIVTVDSPVAVMLWTVASNAASEPTFWVRS